MKYLPLRIRRGGYRLVVVGEVLPLIVDDVIDIAGDGQRLIVPGSGIYVVVKCAGVAVTAMESEPRCEDESFDRGYVHESGTSGPETLGLRICPVEKGVRMPEIARVAEYGYAIDSSRRVSRDIVAGFDGLLDSYRNFPVFIYERSDRV